MSKEVTFNDKVAAIRNAIELDIDKDNLDELQGKMMRLVNLIGLSSELKARASKDLHDAELVAIFKHKGDFQPSVLKMVVDGETANERSKYVLADRLNAGITHAIDAIRTVISLKKTEMDKSI